MIKLNNKALILNIRDINDVYFPLEEDSKENRFLKKTLYNHTISKYVQLLRNIKDQEVDIYLLSETGKVPELFQAVVAKVIHLEESNAMLKLKEAFKQLFDFGYTSVLALETGFFRLSYLNVIQAFYELKSKGFVFGPTDSNDFFLIGMNQFYQSFFEEETDSNESLLAQRLIILNKLNISYAFIDLVSTKDYVKQLREELKD